MVFSQHFCTGCWDWQNALQSLIAVVNWLDGLIGPGQVAISSLLPFAVPVLVLGLRLRESKQLISDVRNTVARPHTEYWWSCSKMHLVVLPVQVWQFDPTCSFLSAEAPQITTTFVDSRILGWWTTDPRIVGKVWSCSNFQHTRSITCKSYYDHILSETKLYMGTVFLSSQHDKSAF